MAQIIPIAAGAAQKRATEALKGDIFTRTTTRTVGKGKKKREVEDTLHVNPLTVILAGVGAAGAAVLGVIAMHGAGKKPSMNAPRLARRIVDEYQPVYEDVKVVDTPAQTIPHTIAGHYVDDRVWNPISHQYEDISVWVPESTLYEDVAEASHMEHRVKSAERVVVMSMNYRPMGTYPQLDIALVKMQARYRNARELAETKSFWVTVAGRQVFRHLYEFRYDGAGIVGLTKDDKWGGGGIDIPFMPGI